MDIISVNKSNIGKEHICCAISDGKGETCVSSKKAWMTQRFEDGLVFKRLDARGKVFIEYIPAENAWTPVEAPGCYYINCFWVSGQFKGRGWGTKLLDGCIADAREAGKTGVAVLSSPKKLPFLSDPRFLKAKGFVVCDTAQPYYELLYLPLGGGAAKPCFKDCCKAGEITERGFVLYYSNQCPHTDKYAPLLEKNAKDAGVAFRLVKFETKEQARNAPAPFTTYSLFYNGKFVTNEILSEAKFAKMMRDYGAAEV